MTRPAIRAPAEQLVSAGLDTHASQRVFRVLLGALARPGTLGRLDVAARQQTVPWPLLVPLALADVDTAIAVLAAPGSTDWQALVAATTGASPVAWERADLAVALRAPTPDEVRSLRRGHAEAPELGARLVLACDRLRTVDTGPAGDASLSVALSGPGVPRSERRRLAVAGLPVEVVETLVTVNSDFPAGVDAFLVDGSGAVAGVPRSAAIRIELGEGTWATRR